MAKTTHSCKLSSLLVSSGHSFIVSISLAIRRNKQKERLSFKSFKNWKTITNSRCICLPIKTNPQEVRVKALIWLVDLRLASLFNSRQRLWAGNLANSLPQCKSVWGLIPTLSMAACLMLITLMLTGSILIVSAILMLSINIRLLLELRQCITSSTLLSAILMPCQTEGS